MVVNDPCPVCMSAYTLYVQDVVGRRSGRKFPQYVCLDCRSFFNFSGYREDDYQQLSDFEFVRNHQTRISRLQNQLALEIFSMAPGIKTCAEIGCGIGLFVKACSFFNVEACGFEINPHAMRYARDVIGVRCEDQLFTREHKQKYDLIAAIGVFEHLERPRDLFATMVEKLNPDGWIYLSVPFVERRDWRYLWSADKEPAAGLPDPFHDNDVHIVHFSIQGLMDMGRQLGARACEYFVSKDTVDNSTGAYHGVLFRF